MLCGRRPLSLGFGVCLQGSRPLSRSSTCRNGGLCPLPARVQQRAGRRRAAPPTQAKGSRSGGGSEVPFGNQNRLAPDRLSEDMPASGTEPTFLMSTDNAAPRPMGGPPREPPPPMWRRLISVKLGQLQYSYFNWRQDTWSDLQLFMVLNLLVFMAGAWVEGAVIRSLDITVEPPPEGSTALGQFWYNLYSVLAVVLSQDLPAGEAGIPSQLFAIFTAVFGLASFALVLALIEQVVLEVLESNVKRGSTCYEEGHTVVLAYCSSMGGISLITRILTQLCAANRGTGGGVVVVLTQQRGKLEMEQLFREAVPDHQRLGTRFVFRQGSPLDPAALRLVAVPDARSIIVCSDYSKSSRESDAQVLRTCVLVDELCEQERPGQAGPTVAAQVKTEDALPLVRYACSERVIPVPTNKLNARRYVRVLRHPIAAVFSRCLSDFYSPAHGAIDRRPDLEGLTFEQLHLRLPEAIVVGLTNTEAQSYELNPEPDRVVMPGDELILLRSDMGGPGSLCVLPEAPQLDFGGWERDNYAKKSLDDQPMGVDAFSSADACLALSGRSYSAALSSPSRAARGQDSQGSWGGGLGGRGVQVESFQPFQQGLFMVPMEYSQNLSSEDELLVCGWMGQTFMWELMAELDHSDQALPPGSRVTLLNAHTWSPDELEAQCEEHGIVSLRVQHVRGDPRSRLEMQRMIDVTKYKGAIVVCDSLWAGNDAEVPSLDAGLRLLSQAEMLSLDAAVLMVQLNIRLLLEEARRRNINILCEKLTYVGVTRFEDDARLPLGVSINSASYSAKVLTQVSVDPRYLAAYLRMGSDCDIAVQDASAFAEEGEELCFMQLQARAASVHQVLMGYYRVPTAASEPLEMVVNPTGLAERTKLRVWNTGNFRCKLVTMAPKRKGAAASGESISSGSFAATTSGSADDGSSGSPSLDPGEGMLSQVLLSGSASISGSGSESELGSIDSGSGGDGTPEEGESEWFQASQHALPPASALASASGSDLGSVDGSGSGGEGPAEEGGGSEWRQASQRVLPPT